MKYSILLTLSLLLASCGGTGSKADAPEPDNYNAIPWVSMNDVESKVERKPKKILVDVYTQWCGPCKMMDRNTFSDPEIINMIGKNFYAVKFDAEGPNAVNFKGKDWSNPGYNPARAKTRNAQHQLTPTFGIRGYPSLVIMDENLNIIDKITGYRDPARLKADLSKYL